MTDEPQTPHRGELPFLRGKTIVVTGSASGVGRACAQTCTAMGATVLGVDIERAFDHVEEFYRADLGDPRSLDALAEVLPEGVDGLVNALGVPARVDDATALQIGLLGVKRLTAALAPRMADGASVVTLGGREAADWVAALPAIRAARELGFEDVESFLEAQGLAGGALAGFMARALAAWALQPPPPQAAAGLRMNTVIHAAGSDDAPGVADVASVVAFLLSDRSRAVRGAILPADGGQTSEFLCGTHGL
ncbi:SDR family oxidoreductase [Alkalilacustris brevis]|uniref:SDR family oxidoreductase n=1 Tax=Alkalilacustris brevis TaxID=2026338 RepID=UPI000E0DBB18|nr:SDR family oxidoreductase [Alkalilacustris brevis]